MCSAATRVYGGCLTHWGAEWADAGFVDEKDYFHSCETWAWEMRMLEKDAKRKGHIDSTGHVDDACLDSEDALLSDDMRCADWSAIDWGVVPWSR